MNSKEALETIGMTKTNNIKSESLSKPRVMYLVKELRKKEIQTIKQDLDRLEKLEKENQELVVNKNVAQGIAIKLKEENDKLKQALEILKYKFKFELGVSVVKEKYYYSLEFLYVNEYLTITQDQYELLKEVLDND